MCACQTSPRVGYTYKLVELLFVSTPPERMPPELGDWAKIDADPIDAAVEIATFVNRR